MKRNSLISSILMASMAFVMCFSSQLAYGEIKNLSEDTYINVSPGNQQTLFKKNTEVIVNDRGNAVKGTLAVDLPLQPPPSANGQLFFKGGTIVNFDEKGYVIRGTVARMSGLNVRPGPRANQAIDFKQGTEVIFDDKGYIVSGTLAHESYLNTFIGGVDGAKVFPEGTKISINDKGLVVSSIGPSPVNVSDLVNETAWSVNSHPVHWVFHQDGTVEARGLWKGNWEKQGQDYQITLVHQSITDQFIVRFSEDGKSFTAYKNGSVYRNGIRAK